MRNLILILAILILLISCKGQNYSTYENSSRSNGIQTDLDIELNLVNKKMEVVYQKTIVFLDSIGTKDARFYKKYLVKSHIEWQDYCESVCKITEHNSRNSIVTKETMYLICRINMSESRINEINKTRNKLKDEINEIEKSN